MKISVVVELRKEKGKIREISEKELVTLIKNNVKYELIDVLVHNL